MTSLARRLGGSPGARNLAVLALYLSISLAFFGPVILPHMHDRILTAMRGDWGLFVWAFTWWPHSIGAWVYPLFTKDLWYPSGLNLAWATVIPTPSLALSWLTLASGPVAAFNVAALLAPATAAWTAFLLLARLTRRALAPSIAGGFVFGFSPYVMVQLFTGHLNLSLALMIPVCAYLVVRLADGSLTPGRFLPLMVASLVVQFGISTEIFATMAVFGIAAGAIGALVAPPARRRQVISTCGWAAAAFALAGVLLSPYLYATFAYPQPVKPLFEHPVGPVFLSDLARLVVPGKPEIFGQNFGQPWTDPWYFHLERFGWYVPVPLLAIVVHLWIGQRRRPAVKLAATVFVCALALALGPAVAVGSIHIPLPWSAVQILPLIKRAFPYRMMAYASLALAACVAYWLAAAPRSWRRWSVFGLSSLLLVPNIGGDLWTRDALVPAFFTSGEYRTYLTPGEVVWIVDREGARQMLWQASTGMYLRLAGGYTGVTPPDLADRTTELRMVSGSIGSGDAAAIAAFVSDHAVGAVIVGDEPDWVIAEISDALGVAPVRTGGVTLLKLQGQP